MRDALGLFAAIVKLAVALSASGCTVMLAPEAVHVPAPEVTPEPAPAPAVEVPADLPDDASRPTVDPCAALQAELTAAQAKVAELESRPVAVTTEADYWDSLAGLVESGRVTDTDVLLKMAELLKADGRIADESRLAQWKPLGARELIGDGNRASIAAKLRGQ